MRRILSTFIFMLLSCAVFAQTKAELYDRFSQAVSEHDTTTVVSLISDWARLYPGDAELFSLRANYYFMDAVSDVITLSDEKPADGRGYYVMEDSLGNTQYMYSDVQTDSLKVGYTKAILADGIAKYPDRIDLRLGKVTVHLKVGENASAVKEACSMVEHSVVNDNKWLGTLDKPVETDGVSYMRDCIQDYLSQFVDAEDLASAEDMVDVCVRFYPKDPVFLSDKGVMRFYAGDLKSALDWYLSAYSVSPGDMLIVNNIAYTYEKLGDKQNALKYYRILADSNDAEFSENAKAAVQELSAE